MLEKKLPLSFGHMFPNELSTLLFFQREYDRIHLHVERTHWKPGSDLIYVRLSSC